MVTNQTASAAVHGAYAPRVPQKFFFLPPPGGECEFENGREQWKHFTASNSHLTTNYRMSDCCMVLMAQVSEMKSHKPCMHHLTKTSQYTNSMGMSPGGLPKQGFTNLRMPLIVLSMRLLTTGGKFTAVSWKTTGNKHSSTTYIKPVFYPDRQITARFKK